MNLRNINWGPFFATVAVLGLIMAIVAGRIHDLKAPPRYKQITIDGCEYIVGQSEHWAVHKANCTNAIHYDPNTLHLYAPDNH